MVNGLGKGIGERIPPHEPWGAPPTCIHEWEVGVRVLVTPCPLADPGLI